MNNVSKKNNSMYSVKKSGKNNYKIYEPNHDTRSKDAASQKVVAIEALLRWKHPVKGLIAPHIFIPLAEENGFIIKLGEWVLQNACISLAHSMNLHVVAEGVEQKEEMEYLLKQSVDEIQGYYISRPLPADEIYKLLL